MKSYKVYDSGQKWKITKHGLYLLMDRSYKVKETRIFANGTRDLCVVDKNGVLHMERIEEATPEKIVLIPSYDVAIIEFEEILPSPYVGRFMVLDIDPDVELLFRDVVRRFPGKKGKTYDAYLGREYDKEGGG